MSGSSNHVFKKTQINKGTFAGGKFYNCNILVDSTNAVLTLNKDTFFYDSIILVDSTITIDDAIDVRFYDCSGIIGVTNNNAGSSIKTYNTSNISFTWSAGTAALWTDYGSAFNNNGTGISASESNAVLRELDGRIDTTESNISTLQADLELVQNQIDLILTGNN